MHGDDVYRLCPWCEAILSSSSPSANLHCIFCDRYFPRENAGVLIRREGKEKTLDRGVRQSAASPLLAAFVSRLDLSPKVSNALVNGTGKIEDLFGMSLSDLSKVQNVGPIAAEEVLSALRALSSEEKGKWIRDERIAAVGNAEGEDEAIATIEDRASFVGFVRDLELSVRATNCLLNNFASVKELRDVDRNRLLKVKNLGQKTATEILEAIGMLPEPVEDHRVQNGAHPDAVEDRLEDSLDVSELRLWSRVEGEVSEWLRSQSLEALSLFSFVRRVESRGIVTFGDVLDLTVSEAKSLDLSADHWFDFKRVGSFSGVVIEMEGIEKRKETPPQALDEELWLMTARAGSDSNRKQVAMYCGWDGGRGATLQQVGDRFGLSRERVRQIKSKSQLPGPGGALDGRPWPHLEGAIDFLESLVPCSLQVAELELKRRGIVTRAISIEGIVTAARLVNLDLPFVLGADGSTLVAAEDEGITKRVRRLAGKSIANNGVSSVSEIFDQLRSGNLIKDHFSRDDLIVILESLPSFSWLDSEREWFWLVNLREKRNRLLNLINKVLEVAPQIDIAELYTQLGRHIHLSSIIPPRRVIEEVIRQHPDLELIDSIVTSTSAAMFEVLSDSENAYFEFIRSSGGMATRREVEDELMPRGWSHPAVSMLLSSSPIVKRFRTNNYGLAGATIDECQKSLTLPSKKRRRSDYEWTEDGRLALTQEISRSMKHSGVFKLPKELKRFLHGDYALSDSASERGIIRVNEQGTGWGLGPYLRTEGEIGDRLTLLFDLKTREVEGRVRSDTSASQPGNAEETSDADS